MKKFLLFMILLCPIALADSVGDRLKNISDSLIYGAEFNPKQAAYLASLQVKTEDEINLVPREDYQHYANVEARINDLIAQIVDLQIRIEKLEAVLD